MMTKPSVCIFRPVTWKAFPWIVLLTTVIQIAFAASGDITNTVLPKSSIHLKGKYFPSKPIKNVLIGCFPIFIGESL